MSSTIVLTKSEFIRYVIRYGGEQDNVNNESYLRWVTDSFKEGLYGCLRDAKKFETDLEALSYAMREGLDVEDMECVAVMQTSSELHYYNARGPVSGPLHVDECSWPVGSYGHSTWKPTTSPIKRVVVKVWRKVDQELASLLMEWGI